METNKSDSEAIANQTTIMDYAETKTNGYGNMDANPPTTSNENGQGLLDDMESYGLKSNTVANQASVEDYADSKTNRYGSIDFVPATTSNEKGSDVNEPAPADLGFSLATNENVKGSVESSTENSIKNATSNGVSQEDTNDDGSRTVDPPANGHNEASTNGVPGIPINGEPEQNEYVNKDIMGPEDEEDGEDQTLVGRDTADAGQKKKKKKSKSKRGLVIWPSVNARKTPILTIWSRKHPLDLRTTMLMLR